MKKKDEKEILRVRINARDLMRDRSLLLLLCAAIVPSTRTARVIFFFALLHNSLTARLQNANEMMKKNRKNCLS